MSLSPERKEFECLPKCKKRHIEELVLGCDKCIKKVAVKLTKKENEIIEKLIFGHSHR